MMFRGLVASVTGSGRHNSTRNIPFCQELIVIRILGIWYNLHSQAHSREHIITLLDSHRTLPWERRSDLIFGRIGRVIKSALLFAYSIDLSQYGLIVR
jgi:hypothetical protein